MKKLLFILFISILYVACTGNQPSSAANDSTAASAAEATVNMPYKATYASDFVIGKQSDILTVLN
jgi:hypothetical protein